MKFFKTRIAALCGIMLLSGCAGETSVPSENSDDSSQLSDSENESDPVDETAKDDIEEIADPTEENEPINPERIPEDRLAE